MDQDNKNATGAPSNDTTSALFVSARKKQLEQQEADRRAREKEEQRLAAEAEVRRLEREVEERRRKTEEDAKRAEEEAKRVAAESRAKMAQAAENPDAVLGAQQPKKEIKLPQIPKISMPAKPEKPSGAGASPAGGAATAAKAPLNTKMLAIIGGGVAAVILIVVLIMTLGGGGGGSPALENSYRSNSIGFEFMYPTGWEVEENADLGGVTLNQGDTGMLTIIDATDSIYEFGDDIISATEAMMHMAIETFGLDPSEMPPPSLTKTGDFVSGGVEFESGEIFMKLQAEVIEERLILFIHAVTLDEREAFEEAASEIEFSLAIDPAGGEGEEAGGDEAGEDTAGAGAQSDGVYSNEYISFEYPTDWYALEGATPEYYEGAVMVTPKEDMSEEDFGTVPFVLVADYTNGWNEYVDGSFEEILTAFTGAFPLENVLGTATGVEYLGEETVNLASGSGVSSGMVVRYGDVTCLSQLVFDNNGTAYGSITVGLNMTDEYDALIDGILGTIESVQG